jgi:hypothetical protein
MLVHYLEDDMQDNNPKYTDQVVSDILAILGSRNKLEIMLGAKDFFKMMGGKNSDQPGLQFKFKLCKKYNFCSITLNGLDLYDVEFLKISKLEIKARKTFDNIYAESLREIFIDTTGLELSIPRITSK